MRPAERRARATKGLLRGSAKPAGVPVGHEVGHWVAHGDRPKYPSDEGLT